MVKNNLVTKIWSVAGSSAGHALCSNFPISKSGPDNLKRIGSIGLKIEKLLKDNGIKTYAQLAETEVSRLEAVLTQAEWENIADPSTWPHQAQQFAPMGRN